MPLSGRDSTERKRRFLEALAGEARGNVLRAAKIARIARSRPYWWASTDETFKAAMATAREIGDQLLLDAYEAEVDRRALEGVEGKKRYDTLLTMFRMKKLNPSYRDHQAPYVGGSGGGVVRFLQVDPDGTERIMEIGGAGVVRPFPMPRKAETVRTEVRAALPEMKKANDDAE